MSGGLGPQNGRAYCFDAFPREKFREIYNFLPIFGLGANGTRRLPLAAWRAKPDGLLGDSDSCRPLRKPPVVACRGLSAAILLYDHHVSH